MGFGMVGNGFARRRRHLGHLAASLVVATCVGCVSVTDQGGTHTTRFPLTECDARHQEKCVAHLVKDAGDVNRRELAAFPARYLELWDRSVRDLECRRMHDAAQKNGKPKETIEDCKTRLDAVARYFNPDHPDAPATDIGVALEGGGSKAAATALGALAGLQEAGLLESRVRAVASVSGGSYAASFLFNRLLDRSLPGHDGSGYKDWFRSCIPSSLAEAPTFLDLKSGLRPGSEAPGKRQAYTCDENRTGRAGPVDSFAPAFQYQGHVWLHPDVLLLDGAAKYSRNGPWEFGSKEIVNIGILTAETALTIPFQILARSVFRWPLNSAPSKEAYRHGLERQFGFSPADWQRVGPTSEERWAATKIRRETRTLRSLAELETNREANPIPRWIIGAATPGGIDALEWASTPSRDPLRHQFEITPRGYGAGIYGYANITPQPGIVLSNAAPAHMPIADAVVASAAFFDSEQTLVSGQPARFVVNAFQHFSNINWFTEIPNFNASPASQMSQWLLPFPFYYLQTARDRTTPYIHLNDGGNTENSAVLHLLRRGFKTIVYVHGTQDTDARFPSICHLKNQLELDGHYYVESRDLSAIVDEVEGKRAQEPGANSFQNYLDQLCTDELDNSDLSAFDGNPNRPPESRDPAVARLICARLGQFVSDSSTSGGMRTANPRCSGYLAKFGLPSNELSSAELQEIWASARPWRHVASLFYKWPERTLSFKVCRGVPPRGSVAPVDCNGAIPVSTIHAVVPALSWEQVRSHLRNADDSPIRIDSWNAFCEAATEQRRALRIQACAAPHNIALRVKATMPGEKPRAPAIPCTALAYVVQSSCGATESTKTWPDMARHPEFPQNSFVVQTLHSTYLEFGAHFDLARHRVWQLHEHGLLKLRDRKVKGGDPSELPGDTQSTATH